MNFVYVRAVAAIVTVLCIGIDQLAPAREIGLLPNAHAKAQLYADSHRSHRKGHSVVTPLNANHTTFLCDIQGDSMDKSCGIILSWNKHYTQSGSYSEDARYTTPQSDEIDHSQFIDFNAISHLKIRFSYRGKAKQLRLYLRNANTRTSNATISTPHQFLSLTLEQHEFNQPITLSTEEFSVPQWWLNKADPDTHLRKPRFDNIFQVGLDVLGHAPEDKHFFAVEEITLLKPWLPSKVVYFYLSLMWLSLIAIEWLARLHKTVRSSQSTHGLLPILEEHIDDLEKKEHRDELTGLFNRKGVSKVTDILFTSYPPLPLSIIAMDIDYFKHINDAHGDNAGDLIVKQFAALIQKNIRSIDTLGRWENVKFILICQHPSSADAYNLAEKLRSITANHAFNLENRASLATTMSLGVALVAKDEPFEQALNRADNALYHAKDTGRNCVRMA